VARVHVLTAAVLFGTTGTAQALGPDIEPLAVGTARIGVGAVLLVVIALAMGRARLGGGDRRLVALSGVFVAVYQASFFAAVADTGVAVGTVVALGSAPAFTGVFGRAFAGEVLARRWYAATGLAFVGVCLLTLGGGGGGQVSAPGIALALAAGAGYAGYAVAGKRLLDQGATPEGVMAAVFATGAVLLSPLLFLVPTQRLATTDGLLLALYLGALPTALAYILFARGLERLGASETSTLTLAEPVTALVLGFAVLGERPGAVAVAGAALVLGGLSLLGLGEIAGRVPRNGRDRDNERRHDGVGARGEAAAQADHAPAGRGAAGAQLLRGDGPPRPGRDAGALERGRHRGRRPGRAHARA
jgi:DME family drug/metabolite transporter